MNISCGLCGREIAIADGIAYGQHIRCPYCDGKFEYGIKGDKLIDGHPLTFKRVGVHPIYYTLAIFVAGIMIIIIMIVYHKQKIASMQREEWMRQREFERREMEERRIGALKDDEDKQLSNLHGLDGEDCRIPSGSALKRVEGLPKDIEDEGKKWPKDKAIVNKSKIVKTMSSGRNDKGNANSDKPCLVVNEHLTKTAVNDCLGIDEQQVTERGGQEWNFRGAQENVAHECMANSKILCTTNSDDKHMEPASQIVNSKNDTNTQTYQSSKDKVAIVESESGVAGTGFLCEVNGKKYFITNKHVVKHPESIRAMFQDGFTLHFERGKVIEAAKNRDLVRFEVKADRECLKIAEDIPKIGEEVEFYGNAQGGGVITVTAGKILAIGQEYIEIDSSIQAGNSGSPLIRISDGRVVGVTTASRSNIRNLIPDFKDPTVLNFLKNGDHSVIGTRYDPRVKATREFAVRFASVQWQQLKYGKFMQMVNAGEDMMRFVRILDAVCYKDGATMNDKRLVLEYQFPEWKFKWNKDLNYELRRIANADNAVQKYYDKYDLMSLKNKDNKYGSIGQYSYMDFENIIKVIKDKIVASLKVRLEVMQDVLKMTKTIDFIDCEERDHIANILDRYIRYYEYKNRMQLKGFDLRLIPSNPLPPPIKKDKRR